MSGWPSRPFDWLLEYKIAGQELSVMGGPDFLEFVSRRMGISTPHDGGSLRFRRVREK